MATIVSRPFLGRGMLQNVEILRKNGSQIKNVGIKEIAAMIEMCFSLLNILQIYHAQPAVCYLYTTVEKY